MKNSRPALFLLLTALCAPAISFAQEESPAPADKITFPTVRPERVRWGTRLSFDVSSFAGGRSFYDNGAGFDAGVVMNIRLPRNLYFEPGVMMHYTGVSIRNEVLEDYQLYSGSASLWSLRVPVNMGYSVPLLETLSLQAYTGPWVNFNLSGKQQVSAAPGSPYEKDNSLNEFTYKRVDAQWGFGLQLTWSGHFVLGVSCGVGMTPIRRDKTSLHNEMTMRRNTFQVNLGYNF